jgi:SAM-dependent methyltransferase
VRDHARDLAALRTQRDGVAGRDGDFHTQVEAVADGSRRSTSAHSIQRALVARASRGYLLRTSRRSLPLALNRPQRMSVRHAYDRWAATYDSDLNLTRDTDARAVRSLLAGRRFHAAVEAGCGTGKNTPFYASIAAALTALDFSGEMLTRARAQVSSPHVTFAQHDLAEPWPVPAGSVDLVAFDLVLEHFDSLDAVLGHAATVGRSGATLLVSELHPFKQLQGSQARFATESGEEKVAAYLHHASDFIRAADGAGYTLRALDEWWHESETRALPPRLLTLVFERR